MKQFSQPTKFSRPTKLLTSLALSAFILTGCGDESSTKQPSKEQIQYLSHIDQAEFYQRQGQLKASILEARNAMELQQSKIEPFMIVGQNLLIAGDGRSAQKQFQSILDSDAPEIKTNSEIKQEVSILLAQSLFIQRKADEASTILSEVNTTNTELKVKKLVLLADIATANKQFKKAENYLNEALSSDSTSVITLIGLSKSAFLQKDLSKTSHFIDSAEKIEPNSPQLWLWKAQIAQYEKRWAESEEAYIKALEDIGSYDIMTFEKYKTISDLITVLREQGKAAEAFVYEEVLAKSSPGTTKSTYMSAIKNFQNGEFKKAEADLESILDQSPGHTESGILLGITKYYLGDLVEAEKILSTYLQDSNSEEANKILAATKLKLRRPKEAREILSKLDKSSNDPQLLSLFGIASLTSGDTKTGLEYINKSLDLDPKNSKLRVKLATYYVKTGNNDAAISQLKKVDESSDDYHKANLQLVAIYAKAKQTSKARTLISKWKKKFPSKAEPLIAEAGLASFGQEFAKAELLLKQATKVDPLNISTLTVLSNIQVKLNKHQEALITLETAITKQPNNTSILTQYLSLNSSVGSNDRALSFFESLAKKEPDNKALQLAIAELYARKGDIEKALNITNNLSTGADKSTQLVPAIEAIYNIGVQTAVANNDTDKALQIAKEARKKLPNSLKLGLLLAKVELKKNMEDSAISTLRELKISHSESELPYEFEGDYYNSIKDHARAADAYTLAKAKNNSDKINIKLYNALKAGNKKTKSVEHLKAWNKEAPENPRALALLALHYQASNEKQKAISLYEQLASINSNDVVALNNLAWLYFETNNKAAEVTAKKAYELKQDSAAVADTYGWILFKNNKVEDSIKILKKAHELSPETKEIGLHLVEAYKSQGDVAAADKILSSFN